MSQGQAKKEGNEPTIKWHATVAKHKRFNDPNHQKRPPNKRSIATGHYIAYGVEPKAGKANAIPPKQEGDKGPDDGGVDARNVGKFRSFHIAGGGAILRFR